MASAPPELDGMALVGRGSVGGRREGKAAEMVVGSGDGERSWGGDGKTRRADGTRAGRLRPSDFVEGNKPAS